jgi:heat shock protein HtpX
MLGNWLKTSILMAAILALANFAMFFGGRDDEGRPAKPIAGILVALLAPLAAALDKIGRYAHGLLMVAAEQHPETARMMIINPLSGGDFSGLFSTPPATAERVARLHAMVKHFA